MSQRILDLVPFIAGKLTEQRAVSALKDGDAGRSCLYTSPCGHCAVGHLMTPEVQAEVGDFLGNAYSLVNKYPHALENVLPNITENEKACLNRIQHYHDEGDYEEAMESCKDDLSLSKRIEEELLDAVKSYM